MTLLAIAIVLMLELYFRISPSYRNFRWFQSFLSWIHRQFPAQFESLGGIVFLCGIIPVLLAVLIALPNGLGGTLGYLASSVFVLWYCLGPEDLRSVLNPYFAAMERGDQLSARELMQEWLPGVEAGSLQEMARKVSRWIFSSVNSRYIAPLFWFVLLGPAACLFYRLAQRYHASAEAEKTPAGSDAGAQLMMLLDWLPARVTALVFTLVGDFMRGYAVLHPYWRDSTAAIGQLLLDTGLGALALNSSAAADPLEENIQAIALAERALLLFVALTLLLTLFAAVM